jgi:hypothetical protein
VCASEMMIFYSLLLLAGCIMCSFSFGIYYWLSIRMDGDNDDDDDAA